MNSTGRSGTTPPGSRSGPAVPAPTRLRAAALNAKALTSQAQVQKELFPGTAQPFLNRDEIQKQALEERRDRASSERFTLVRGDMFTGDHKVVSKESRTCTVCFHDPVKGLGHGSCPDYLTSGLGTCKHILYITGILKKEPGFKARAAAEVLPFIDIYWDSLSQAPCLHAKTAWPDDLAKVLGKYFDRDGGFTASDLSLVMGLMLRLHGDRRVRVRENLLKRVDHRLQVLQLEKMKGRPLPRPALTRPLYPFQEAAMDFGVLIGDEMGLGKTVQAIAMSLVKKEVFGFSKILVISLSSLKAMNLVQSQTTSHATAISQVAAIEALQGPKAYMSKFLNAYHRRIQFAANALNKIPGISCRMPRGTFYAFAECTALMGCATPDGSPITTDIDLGRYLMAAAGVAVVPGTAFLSENHFRISCATSTENLKTAIDRIKGACARLQ